MNMNTAPFFAQRGLLQAKVVGCTLTMYLANLTCAKVAQG